VFQPLALLDEAIEKLAEARPDAIGARRAELVDEISERLVGAACCAVEGLRHLNGLADGGIAADVDAQLPDAGPPLPLRPPHAGNVEIGDTDRDCPERAKVRRQGTGSQLLSFDGRRAFVAYTFRLSAQIRSSGKWVDRFVQLDTIARSTRAAVAINRPSLPADATS
jgi:hypothetical protein